MIHGRTATKPDRWRLVQQKVRQPASASAKYEKCDIIERRMSSVVKTVKLVGRPAL